MLKLYLRLFLSFFTIGSFTFGGGFAMIPLIERDVVQKYGWMNSEEFVDMIAVTQSAPGPVAVNSAVFIGYKLAGLAGAGIALLGVTLPSFLIILLIALFLVAQENQVILQKFFAGVRPAVVALILGAGLNLGQKCIKSSYDFLISILCLAVLVFLPVHPILLIITGAAWGVGRYLFLKRREGENC
ncbi:MAG: chromate transporter [Peptococcaceae bacterium]|jgi:chromate transporter|nr:chromate transporter [Peptococcaceae bacterium]MDH7524885.1 chromate transporter [Peptococcaceae bacterium]